MEKKNIIIILVIVAFISIIVGTIIYYGNIIKEGYHYTYTGRDGSEYAFDVIRLEGVKGLYQRVTFALARDDGKIYKYSTLFRNGPKDLENIPLENVSQDLLYIGNKSKEKIYITQDPNLPGNSSKTSSVAALGISKITNGMANVYIYGVPTESAFTEIPEGWKDYNLQKITCTNATNNIAVVLIKMGNEDKIYRDKNNKNCVVLEAKSYDDITKVSDKFIMHLLGIF